MINLHEMSQRTDTVKNTTTTISNVILSIIHTKDKNYIQDKLDTLRVTLELNEVEKQILREIDTNVYIDNLPEASYLKEKFSYYFDRDFGKYLERDAIDNAIHFIKYNQSKSKLARELIALGSNVTSLTPSEIREQFRNIGETQLYAPEVEIPENDFVRKDNAYGDLVTSRDGLSLVIPQVEEHAGKATKGTVVSILAYTGSFKSTYALNIAYENAMKGNNILYLTLEDTGVKMVDRMVLKHIAKTATKRTELITSNKIRDGKLTKDEIKLYNTKHNELYDRIGKHLILWDTQKINYQTYEDMTNVLRMADNKFKEDTGKGLDAIVLDQLSLLKYTTAGGKKYTYDGAVMNDWVIYFNKQVLNFLDEGREIVLFLVSQIGREAYKEASKPKNKGRYDASAPQDSNEIEKTSTTMITLYKDLSTANTLLIGVPKARNGYTTERPIQVEVYGEYYHIGPLNIGDTVTAEEFGKKDFDLSSLIKGVGTND